ncbi:LAQU0S03e09538g1_1 [Lachancea quebecensis]|uniref:U three protein 23 n=1 Tax=Lachancea quebecensis TaxID=1654605 RepID=A0A0P1KQ54_9SACH|nr:LAQU0S03e09538g1_1 [Lachancea quebecensis]
MRQKRAKSYRKQMLIYNHNFKFREPYQVLVDDQIVCDTYKASFDLVKGLQRTLQAEVKPMITQCCIQAIYETKNQDAIELAKSFERRRCNHPPKEAKPPIECLQSVVSVNGNNKHRYVVASQDPSIRRKLRQIPGVPLIYMNRSVMVMEPLSKVSGNFSRAQEKEKLFKGLNDPKYAGLPTEVKKEKTGNDTGVSTSKRKGPKGPNPLSIKKKKATPVSMEESQSSHKISVSDVELVDRSSTGRRRRRHHKRNNAETGEEDESGNIIG